MISAAVKRHISNCACPRRGFQDYDLWSAFYMHTAMNSNVRWIIPQEISNVLDLQMASHVNECRRQSDAHLTNFRALTTDI